MEHLRQQYSSPQAVSPPVSEPPKRVSQYASHVFDPVRYHRWAGYYPLENRTKRLTLELEPAPEILFQHAPKFHYQPHTSNIDVDLN